MPHSSDTAAAAFKTYADFVSNVEVGWDAMRGMRRMFKTVPMGQMDPPPLSTMDISGQRLIFGATPDKDESAAFWRTVSITKIRQITVVGRFGVQQGRVDIAYSFLPRKTGETMIAGGIIIRCEKAVDTACGQRFTLRVRDGEDAQTIVVRNIDTWSEGSAPASAKNVVEAVQALAEAGTATAVLSSKGDSRCSSFVLAGWLMERLNKGIAVLPISLLRLIRERRSKAISSFWDFGFISLIVIQWGHAMGLSTNTQQLECVERAYGELFDKMTSRISAGEGEQMDEKIEGAEDVDAEEDEEDALHIFTEPLTGLVFNAPYDDKHIYHIKMTNAGGRRIGWAIKTTNVQRLGVDPPCGVLDPKEAVLMAVSCDAFKYGEEDTNNDRITIEWTNTPDGAAKTFRREWFQEDGLMARRIFPIVYNP